MAETVDIFLAPPETGPANRKTKNSVSSSLGCPLVIPNELLYSEFHLHGSINLAAEDKVQPQFLTWLFNYEPVGLLSQLHASINMSLKSMTRL